MAGHHRREDGEDRRRGRRGTAALPEEDISPMTRLGTIALAVIGIAVALFLVWVILLSGAQR
jgi:hypothetical protein